jgi:F420-non-reducing hydrogenase iron-sulfur subunit
VKSPDNDHGSGPAGQQKILVFSTNNISDPGIDLAGSSHMHYSTNVLTINVPCTAGVRPSWITRAILGGFDGVFIAADGEECAYRQDCTERTSAIVTRAQEALKEQGVDPARVRMAAICSVCAEPFTSHMREFSEALVTIGLAGKVAVA